MPDVAPDSTPVLFAILNGAHTVVDRQAITMLTDPYSARSCHWFKFEARVGGGTTCPNSARLLMIK
jgi:HK97 family phage major capsid protein